MYIAKVIGQDVTATGTSLIDAISNLYETYQSLWCRVSVKWVPDKKEDSNEGNC